MLLSVSCFSQFNFNYDFNNTGRRVCLISATSIESPPQIVINLHDSEINTTENYTIKRRPINGLFTDWTIVANSVNATTNSWTDTNVALGDAFEYQVSRNTGSETATGYVTGTLNYDQTNYKGQMILVIDDSFQNSLATEILQLKKDLTNEGWFVNELYVPRATTWDTEPEIITVRNQIAAIYNNAPANDKPTHLFLLGHIPIARSGLGAIAPDHHTESKGARGADCYYADIDGVFTDTQTYNPGGIDAIQINLPNDLKWDQEYIPSELEMAFGRVDFADINDSSNTEFDLLQSYLNRLHNYKTVASGFNMGEKTAFNFGYDNSNDGSYRSLIPISNVNNVDEFSDNLPFPQWVQQNGPYQIFMQNIVTPNASEWNLYGMDATIYSSDQSYWGFWAKPQTNTTNGYIRYLLSRPTKCLGIIYTTTGVNIFHQPGMGETMGWSTKRIMEHTVSNNLYEKPEQSFDTNDYWGRTHFQYSGDPTLRLNQVVPPSNLQITNTAGEIDLTWTASTDTNIIGYHIYKSASEFGVYSKLTTAIPITQLTFNDAIGIDSDWYMIRAIKLETTGSGTYLNPSIGVNASNQSLSVSEFDKIVFSVFPNPTNETIWIKSNTEIISKTLFDVQGRQVKSIKNKEKNISIANLNNGVYFLQIEAINGFKQTIKILKQ